MSIASRITSIEGHISDIYDSVELTGVDTTDIDKNLVNVPNTLKEGYIDIINNGTDTLYNNFPKVSGEGTSLTLNNTYQAPMRNNLKGNTSQTGTPTPTSPIPVNVVSGDNEILVNGKNFFPVSLKYNGTSILQVRSTITLDNDEYVFSSTGADMYLGAVVASGSAFSNSYGSLIVIPSNATDVYLYVTNSDFNNNFICFYDANKSSLGYSSITTSKSIPSGAKYFNVRIGKSNSVSGTTYRTKVMVSFETITTYEPYTISETYNIDLPSGMELCKIGNYQDKFLRSNGTNLAPNNLSSETYNSLEITNNNNGTFTLYGNPTGSFGRDIATNLTLKAGTYTISANEMPSGLYIALDNEADTQLSNGTLSKTFTLANDTTYTSLGIWFTKNKDYDVTIKLQIEEGSSASEWQPYGVGEWYLHKEIGKYIYNNVGSVNTPKTNYYNISGLTNQGWINTADTNTYLSTEYPSVSVQASDGSFQTITANMDYAFGLHLNGTTIRFKDNRGLSASDFKNDIVGTEIYFALATPTSEGIPTNLINQLEELYIAKSKENQTNISQINNDLGFIISASALKKG